MNSVSLVLSAAALLVSMSVFAGDSQAPAGPCVVDPAQTQLGAVATQIEWAHDTLSHKMQFILVRFPSDRAVLIDDSRGTWRTNEILQVSRAPHVIRIEPLPGEQSVSPAQAAIVVKDTSVLAPMVVEFK